MTPLFYKLLTLAVIIAIGGTAFNVFILPRIAPQVACIVRDDKGDIAKAWGRDCYRGNMVFRFTPQ